MAILEVRAVSKSFKGLHALTEVDLAVDEGQIVGIIGANGAGKTTLFNCVAGAFPPTKGHVLLGGEDVTGWPSHRLARRGLVRTFQLMRPFHTMTVLENVETAAMSLGLKGARARREAGAAVERTGLAEWAHRRSGSLPAGMLKRLELARALAMCPKVLLLDEVLAGLVPSERAPVLDLLEALRVEEKVTVVFIEHIMAAVRRLSDEVVMMDQGRVLARGQVENVLSDPQVVEAYLGGGPNGA
ncbi:MAG: ABC transporter ATP-binding protein [Bifidobacteriaceae bacterium]|jgi:branched-chain amino acid transport system ATP-binding protein|nr:ABC transporter ATP-binding protein [Bifidobacteriaceae bacterium]